MSTKNRDVQAAWHYHNGTKHPNGSLMNRWHSYDPADNPLPFKIYTELGPISLVLDASPTGVSALSAISIVSATASEKRIPDLSTLTWLLWFSAGVTKKITYPWGEMLFRAAACTGALYHIELYVVSGDIPGLSAGVYHFAPHDVSLRRLRSGDFRGQLIEASGNEAHITKAPLVIVYTDVFWRNAVKYQVREYRHAFWDSGTMLAHTLAIAAAHQLPATLVEGFVDDTVNRLLDLDTEREAALALLPIGYDPVSEIRTLPEMLPLNLETVPISDTEIVYPAITAFHEASSLTSPDEAAAWRGEMPRLAMTEATGQIVPLKPYAEDQMPKDSIEEVIMRRGSTRRFAQVSITFEELSTILQEASRGVPADFLLSPGATLNVVYLIVNAVENLIPGAYVYYREREALELLKPGDFRERAGLLGLQQALPFDASVDIFLMADLHRVLERLGNRGYRAAQLDASITAGRIYLAAYALGLGATGLTFFDDMVTDFFSPHGQNKSTMFCIAIGRKASRQ